MSSEYDDSRNWGAIEDEKQQPSLPTVIRKGEKKKRPRDEIDLCIPEIQNFLGDPTAHHVKTEEGGEITCRACKKGYFVGKDEIVDRIAMTIRSYAFVVSRPALIDTIYKICEFYRSKAVTAEEDDPGEWTHEEIDFHLFTCMTDPGLICLKQISDLKEELESLRKVLWRTNPDGTREPDKNVASIYFATQKQLKDFLTMAPEKTVAYNPKLDVQRSSRKG